MSKDKDQDPADLLKQIRQHFLKTVADLAETVEINTRMDIRDKIAALSLIDRVLAREKPDESDRAGSAVRQFAPNFQRAHGASGGPLRDGSDNTATESVELGDSGTDGGESAEADDESDAA